MSLNRQLVKTIKKIAKQLSQVSRNCLSAINKKIIWLLRTLFVSKRRRSSANAGFVLPTVAMVSIVVVLLTTAILFRSFERSKNASNVRVNEVVLNAATPAIDRARAKIDALIEDPTLPRGTPSDSALYDVLKRDKYSLGDETRLKLAYNFNSTPGIQTNSILEDDETLRTAWKFAVDTDNNGLKDTFTLYGIYFRTPTRDASTGQFNRKRNPLEARTPPMDNDSTNAQCSNAAGFSSLVGNSSWYKLQSGNLGKSFFVYTVNVPITNLGSLSTTDYEVYTGNKSFVALELQQDRSRIPLPNNAVWFENDLEIITGSTALLLNGRVHTNGNLLVGVQNSSGNITFRQVSSKTSCFYNQENGQISVGGNVGNGSLSQVNTGTGVTVDMYRGYGSNIATKSINNTNKSTNQSGGSAIGFNDAAFNERIAAMKNTAKTLCTTCYAATTTTGTALKTAVAASGYPSEVKTNVAAKVQNSDDGETAKNILSDEIEIYLRNRTRRVPFAEVADATGTGATTGYTAITANLEPQATWREPLNASNQFTDATSVSVTTSQMEATYPVLQKQEGVQTELGDRLFVGNNLPALWKQGSEYVGSVANQLISSVNWTRPTGADAQQRWRNTQIQALSDLGISERNGFWEEKAVENPVNDLDSVGGVRIVTGAGIYVDGPGNTVDTTNGPFYPRDLNSFLPVPNTADSTVVWPDTMPMSSPADPNKKGDLIMRATAVYHYKNNHGTAQTPIACVSSYYDPSDRNTAKNRINQDGGYGVDTTNGRSNNGVVYDFPGRSTFTTNKTLLTRQANLKFPNGRWANKPLQDALAKIGTATTVASTGLQLADYSAIDTALCAISILEDETDFVTTPTDQPQHGAIKEATFLDARETKQISASSTSSTYDLDLEQRQPLEIRVTDIDLSTKNGKGITNTAITANEYLLPYSGIIYATRDDALLDESEPLTNPESKLLSPTDFKLDPTRRPNGVRLINGETLARTSTNAYNPQEKGMILVTNLPAYIKGTFNLHRTSTTSTTEIEEFTETEPVTNFYNRSTPNNNFACRPGRTGCPTTGNGDYWRPATIIADSMTLLSDNFKDGVRSEGDYDLNNNTAVAVEDNFDPATISSVLSTLNLDQRRQDRLKNGFWENDFATSTDWLGNTNRGSYTVNGVTPIQRRADGHPMYVMEICRKLLVSECQPNDWVVGFDVNGDDDLDDTVTFDANGDGTADSNDTEKVVKANKLGQAIATANGSSPDTDANDILTNNELNWTTKFPTTADKSIRERLGAGDTGEQALVEADRRYPRRVAFARYGNGVTGRINNELVSTNTTAPLRYKPMGIGCPLDITGTAYTNNGCIYASSPSAGTNYGQLGNSALWFRTTNSSSNPGLLTQIRYRNDRPLFYYPPIDANNDGSPDLDGQPFLVPVLQIHDAMRVPLDQDNNVIRTDGTSVAAGDDFRDDWLQQPTDTTFNATFVLGNSPGRAVEISSGLQNFVRFLENWEGETAKISGSFIQLKRSAFSTGPLAQIFTARNSTTSTVSNNLSLFDYRLDNYPTQNGPGLLPYYWPPDRRWGFDVGLLSEQPDLFAQRFTVPPIGRPNEFFREVGRDDPWVQALLCAGEL